MVNRALDATLKGVKEAVDAVTELKIFDLNNFEGHGAYQTLEESHEHIKKCHDSLFDVRLTSAASPLDQFLSFG